MLGVIASGYFERQVRLQAGTTRGTGTTQQVGRGRPRVGDEALLAHFCVRVGKERIQKLMRLHGIKARGKRRFVVTTTDSKHDLPIAPNLLARDFSPARPDAVWTGDITYISTAEGWLYLAAVIDLHSRQVVGWSMQPNMQTSLVADALRMAWFRRRPAAGLIFHSDRGSQYCSAEFQAILTGNPPNMCPAPIKNAEWLRLAATRLI